MASPRSKKELSVYLSILYDCLEREQTCEPTTAKELRKEIETLKIHCMKCDVAIPSYDRGVP